MDMKAAFEMRTAPDAIASADWWRHLFEASDHPQALCLGDGTVELLNPAARRFFGPDPARLPGRIQEFLAPPADAKLGEALQRNFPTSTALHFVALRFGRCTSPTIEVEIVAPGPGYFVVSFKDLSPRMRLEAHVQRLVTAIDATPDVFFLTDAECRISFVNPAFQCTTGYQIEEVLGRADEFLRAPHERERVREYREQLQQGREWSGQLTNVRPDGSFYPVEATLSPISDMAGQFIGYVASERDITARRQLEDALKGERDFVRSILHSLEGAIYTLDRDFRLTHTNDGWRQLPAQHGGLHIEAPPQIGRSILELAQNEERRLELRAAFAEVLGSGQASEHRHMDEHDRHWLVRVAPWINAGEICGLICSISDQTRARRVENQLVQAQKMEIIGTLAAGVAHDFNNLLQAIRGYASLVLQNLAPNTDPHRWARQIDLASQRAAEITRQLLTFSRQSEERRVVLDLNQAIGEASHMARRSLRGNVSLELLPSVEPVRVRIDFTRANQVLLNLCVNAQDAMPDGGRLTITNSIIELTPEQAARNGFEAGQRFARCSVADTGSGMPPELVTRVFDPFFTTKEKGRGTGLGLSIVRRVMQEADGFVEVESKPGRGTNFHLYFPEATEEVSATIDSGAPLILHGSGCVLVVDDLDLLRDFTRSFLEAAGFTVLVAENATAALQVLENADPRVDLIFTDYNMPGGNGLDLIREVDRRWPGIKRILASGYLDDTTRQQIESLGIRVLAKPYDMQRAGEAIVQMLAPCEESQVPDPAASLETSLPMRSV